MKGHGIASGSVETEHLLEVARRIVAVHAEVVAGLHKRSGHILLVGHMAHLELVAVGTAGHRKAHVVVAGLVDIEIWREEIIVVLGHL